MAAVPVSFSTPEHGIRRHLLMEVLRRFGRVRFRARGSSMVPAVRDGDLLAVEHRPFEMVRPGDIVLCCRGERLFAHRVVRWDHLGAGLVAQGDRLSAPDPPIRDSDYLGVVVGRRAAWPTRLRGMISGSWLRRW